jgi:hypothetical protein
MAGYERIDSEVRA